MKARPRLLFLITEDWHFWPHRLDLDRAAKHAEFAVISLLKAFQDDSQAAGYSHSWPHGGH